MPPMWLSSRIALCLLTCLVESLRLDQQDFEHGLPENIQLDRAIHGPSDTLQIYQTVSSSKTKTALKHASMYGVVTDMLANETEYSHSVEVLKYVSTSKAAPLLPLEGCLYLPSDPVWRRFYRYIEHPYPPLFREMIASSFYPSCNGSSLRGDTIGFCGSGKIQGQNGCFRTKHLRTVDKIEIYSTAGIVGLPKQWSNHMDQVDARGGMHERRVRKDQCRDSDALPEVSPHEKLVIPVKYVVCLSKMKNHSGIDDTMIKAQHDWVNLAYKGDMRWTKMPFETSEDHPPKVDMQIEFEFKGVTYVQDVDCAKEGFLFDESVNKFNTDPTKLITVVILTEDVSGILGMAPLPMETGENSTELLVMVSSSGLRGWSSKLGSADLTYDEGDTVVHEIGHSLGLYHTFEGGCAGDGDLVSDTPSEEFPNYLCEKARSCGGDDPIHNFMDYTPDSCMSGFTEMQKRRAWCVAKKYRPTLYSSSLRQEATTTMAADADDAQPQPEKHHRGHITDH